MRCILRRLCDLALLQAQLLGDGLQCGAVLLPLLPVLLAGLQPAIGVGGVRHGPASMGHGALQLGIGGRSVLLQGLQRIALALLLQGVVLQRLLQAILLVLGALQGLRGGMVGVFGALQLALCQFGIGHGLLQLACLLRAATLLLREGVRV